MHNDCYMSSETVVVIRHMKIHWIKLYFVQAACWSPEGKTLLFATENEPIIYSLTFSTSIDDTSTVIGGSQSAVVSVNLRETEIATEDGKMMK